VANTEVERHTGVDVEDVPSAQWGWSQENYRLIHIGGLLSAVTAGDVAWQPRRPHRGRVPDLPAALIVFAVGRDWWLRRRGWIR
jgi:hypothetical protein